MEVQIKKIFMIFVMIWGFSGLSVSAGFGADVESRSEQNTGYVPRVVEVRYIGLSHIGSRELELVLPFSPGDPWKASFLESTQKTFLKYYAKRGFYQALVQVKIVPNEQDVIVVVTVTEGKPCMIRTLALADPPGIKGKANTMRLKRRMEEVLKIKVGERYDEQELAEQLRQLREFLGKEDFILVNTDNIKLKFNDYRTEVDVELPISFGDRVTFGFRGHSVFTKGELNDTIAQLKTTELGKDYVGMIVRKFEENYRGFAFNNIHISTEVRDNSRGRHVTFIFNEGTRTQIESLQFEGMTETYIQEVTDLFYEKSSRLIQRGYYVEKDLDKALEILLETFRVRGYLSIKLVSKIVQPIKDRNRVKIVLQILEGDQTIVEGASIRGNLYFSSDEIKKILTLKEGEPFNPYGLEEGLQKIQTQYKDNGFLDISIKTPIDQIVTFSENNRKAKVTLELREGTRYRIGDIRVQGLNKTREYVVWRELSVQSENWWLNSDLQQDEEALKRLGIFAEVKLRSEPSKRGNGYKDLVVDLRESEPGVVEFGPGFRSDLGLRLFSSASYNNFLGRNQIVSLSGSVNRRILTYRFPEYNVQTTFVDPRLFSSKFGWAVGLSTSKRQFFDFNIVQTQFFTSIDRKIFSQLLGKLTYKLERIRQFGALFAVDNQTLLIGSLTPALTFDTRDHPFVTTKGQVTTVALEWAQPLFAGMKTDEVNSVGYYKWTGSTHVYLPVTKNIVWSNVVSIGFLQDLVDNKIPLIKTFRLGGYGTLRGFREDSINKDQIAVKGTLSFLNMRTQIDLPFIGDLKFSPFVDAGNIYVDRFESQPFFRVGVGAGFHYVTPIGPINFDYGINVNRLADEPSGQFHFSVGLI